MRYDCVIIGAGLSGLAAAVRLAHFGKKICVLEKHDRPGGLNSYYRRKPGLFETGLHAVTNFAPENAPRSARLLKLLRQLRIPYADLMIREQNHSLVKFPEVSLRITNNFEDLAASVAENFPAEKDGFRELDKFVERFDEIRPPEKFISARGIVSQYIRDPLLADMLLCPLMFYGNPAEKDMDLSIFAVMYKSIYKEGMFRPAGDGILHILSLLERRIKESGGEIRYSSGVGKINCDGAKALSVTFESGETLEADAFLSCAGYCETAALTGLSPEGSFRPEPGVVSYMESIACFEERPKDFAGNETIIFYSLSKDFKYERPAGAYDSGSGIVCFPSNFKFLSKEEAPPFSVRISVMTNHEKWLSASPADYKKMKKLAESDLLKTAEEISGLREIEKRACLTETATPKTILRYTGHINGTVYGSPVKRHDGSTFLKNLFICGTDQGFYGVAGSLLSGISIANAKLLS